MSDNLLKRADEWSIVGRDLIHSDTCYLIHTPCLIRALAARVRELEAELKQERVGRARDREVAIRMDVALRAERDALRALCEFARNCGPCPTPNEWQVFCEDMDTLKISDAAAGEA